LNKASQISTEKALKPESAAHVRKRAVLICPAAISSHKFYDASKRFRVNAITNQKQE
jgi:hypothetical protein